MPLTLSTDDGIHTNDATLSDAPAVRITGSRVRLINSEAGRLISTDAAQPAIEVTGIGSKIFNELGGIIRNISFDGLAIVGGNGNDEVDNAGLISGRVVLGNGDDVYIERANTSNVRIDLGSGGDRYELFGGSIYNFVRAEGGAGIDDLVINASSYVNAANATGFERLKVTGLVSNALGFSGFIEIGIDPGASINFLESLNPSVDLVFSNAAVSLGFGSSLGSITGGNGIEYVSIGPGGTVLGAFSLGGGDDELRYQWHSFFLNQDQPVLGAIVDGGAGTDRLQLSVSDNRTIDLSRFTGFEQLNTGTYTSLTSTVRVIHADAFSVIEGDGDGGILTIAETFAPNSRVQVSFGGVAVLENSTTIGGFGYTVDISQEQQGNDLFNITLFNRGMVLGDVKLYLGDDLYDARGSGAGNVGGTIFGYAGNDTFYGSSGADRIDGGFGRDLLIGGLGADVLIGGGGSDTASYEDNQGGVIVNLTLGRGYANASFDDTYAGIENVRGTIFADTLIGSDATNILEGGGGNDTLIGALGADSLVGGEGIDTASYEDNQGGVFVNLASGAGASNAAQGDTYSGIENVTGSIFNDTLIGNDGVNRLEGGGGNDEVIGGLGGDALIGGSGSDTASYEDNQGAVFVNLTIGQGFGNAAQGDSYSGIENVTGTVFYDTIIGDGNANVLRGALGNDTLTGAGGADSFVFDTALNATINVDTITDFDPVADSIRLGATVFSAIGAGTLAANAFATGSAATTADHRIIHDPSNGRLFYDPDGTGSAQAIWFATVNPGTPLTNDDFIIA